MPKCPHVLMKMIPNAIPASFRLCKAHDTKTDKLAFCEALKTHGKCPVEIEKKREVENIKNQQAATETTKT